jgi:hypothetical protein
MKEPPRNNDPNSLESYVADRFKVLYERMRARGFDPEMFEAKRSKLRQFWLYGYGRWHHIGQPKKTWTLLSRHIPGKAADTVSKSRWWDWPEFFTALIEEGSRLSLFPAGKSERCHLEWR